MYLTQNRKWTIIVLALLLAMIIGIIIPSITNGQVTATPTVELVSFSANGYAEGGVRVVVTLTRANPATNSILVRIHRHTVESLQNGGLGQVVYEGSDYPIIDFVDTDLEYGQTSIWQMVLYESGREARYYGMPAAVSGIPHSTRLAGDEVYINDGGFQSVHFTWEYWGVRPNHFQICGAKQRWDGHWGEFDTCSELLIPDYSINSYDLRIGGGNWLFRLTTVDPTGNQVELWYGPVEPYHKDGWAVYVASVLRNFLPPPPKPPVPTPVPLPTKPAPPTPIPDTPD